jgi:PAS domain S-box-containing protein
MTLTGNTTAPPKPDQELLDLLLEASTDGLMDWDLVGGRIRYTDRWKLLLGYEAKDLPDSPTLWSDLSHPDDLPGVQQALDDHLHNFWPFTQIWRMRHANQEWRSVMCRAVTTRDAQGSPRRLVAVFSDITDRIRAEERHRALGSAIPDLLLRVRGDGLLLDVKSPDWTGAGELIWPSAGQRLSDWAPAASWHERVTACLTDAPANASKHNFEVTLAAGSRRYAEVRVVPSGEQEVVCIVRDVTEQKRLQTQLMQAHKLESIGQLAAGIAHEINTPMQFIGDNLRFVQEAGEALLRVFEAQDRALEGARKQPLSDAEHQALTRTKDDADLEYVVQRLPGAVSSALEGVRRVAHIVGAMKEFSHPGKEAKGPCDLNRELETTITISANVWKYVADVERQFDANLPPVSCYSGEINQVVLNLIVNAAHAIGDVVGDGSAGKGTITVSTSLCDGQVQIRVSDTGTGIPEAIRHRIFDPFFTTKDVGRGTGQGLAIARSTIVDRHGGTLEFESETGKGTTFIILLPLAIAGDCAAE